jgi:hypothetical protein
VGSFGFCLFSITLEIVAPNKRSIIYFKRFSFFAIHFLLEYEICTLMVTFCLIIKLTFTSKNGFELSGIGPRKLPRGFS